VVEAASLCSNMQKMFEALKKADEVGCRGPGEIRAPCLPKSPCFDNVSSIA
jgi:hypothetical protein